MVCGRRSADEKGREKEEGRRRRKRRTRRTAGGREMAMEGSVATRKVRAKRFVECFMESFRIVDFLSPVAPDWIYDGRRTRKRTSAISSLLVQPARATENIKGYYLNSRKVRFLRRRGGSPSASPRERSRSSIVVSWRRQTAVKVFPCRYSSA